MTDNGNGEWGKTIIRHRTMSGVMCHITPLNIATLKAIRMKAAEVYPYPDKEPYRLPLENVASPDIKDDAENNPAYREVVQGVNEQRQEFEDKAIIALAVKFPDYPTPDDLVRHFAVELMNLRKFATLPDDDYEATLEYCVFSGNKVAVQRNKEGKIETITAYDRDFDQIKNMALQYVPLSLAEVTQGIRFLESSTATSR